MAEKQKVGARGVGKDAAGSVVAFKGAPTTVATKASPNWWEAWFAAPVRLDWTIVRNTTAFKMIPDGEKFLQALKLALPGAWPTCFQIREAADSLGRLNDFEAIDDELWTRGLRVSVAWCAVDAPKESVRHWVDKIREFREKTPYVDLGPHDAAPMAASLKVNEIESRLKPAKKTLIEMEEKLKDIAARKTSKPAEAAKKASDHAEATKRRDAQKVLVASIEAELAPAYAALRKVEERGIYARWSYGGDKSFALKSSNVRADLKLLTERLLALPYIKTPTVPKDEDDPDFRRVLTHLVETHVRYFDREGAPNSVGTWDETFTLGTGMNATGGAGPQFLQELVAPRPSRFEPLCFDAIPVARSYLQRRGIALLPILGDVNIVHVAHIEPSQGNPVLYRVSNRYLPSDVKEEVRIHSLLIVPSVGKDLAKKMAADAIAQAKASEKFGKNTHEHWLAFEFLRRQPQALRAFAALGTQQHLPAEEDPDHKTVDYRVAHALNQAGLSTLYEHSVTFNGGSFHGLRMRPLIRRSALTTFLHHIRQWWGTGPVAPTMAWAIARGLVRSKHRHLQERESSKLIEKKGDGVGIAGEPWEPPPPPKGKPPKRGATDADDEDDVRQVYSFEVDASDLAQVQFARAAWLFTQFEKGFWDNAADSKDAVASVRWAISCKIWWEFCYDFALELDPSVGGNAGVPGAAVAQVRTILDDSLGKDMCRFIPVEPYEDVVERVAHHLFDESPWRWDPNYPVDADGDVKGTFPKPDSGEFQQIIESREFSDDVEPTSAFARLVRAAMHEVDELYVVKFLSEHHLRLANTQVFGPTTPFGSPYLKPGLQVLGLKRDAQEMSLGPMLGVSYSAAEPAGAP